MTEHQSITFITIKLSSSSSSSFLMEFYSIECFCLFVDEEKFKITLTSIFTCRLPHHWSINYVTRNNAATINCPFFYTIFRNFIVIIISLALRNIFFSSLEDSPFSFSCILNNVNEIICHEILYTASRLRMNVSWSGKLCNYDVTI